MAVAALTQRAHHCAAAARVPVYPVVGVDARDRVETLLSDPALDSVASPRQAAVLLVAGALPSYLGTDLKRLHDQLPHPRTTASWCAEPPPIPASLTLGNGISPSDALVAAHGELYLGRRESESDLLPDEPPAPWQGVGEHGQGGEGMMGGKPFGRPMAMTGQDPRDALPLDAVTVDAGPFLSTWPPGLKLRLTLQGDVVTEAALLHPPFRQTEIEAPFRRALREPVAIAELERARAAHHLRALARFLETRELRALRMRFIRKADAVVAGELRTLESLRRYFRLSGAALAIGRGLGTPTEGDCACLQGPALRAAGADRDARTDHPVYRRLGFRPVCGGRGDTASRLGQWLAEAEQSLALAEAAGDVRAEFPDGIEGPTGPIRDAAGELPSWDLESLLTGLEWDEMVAVLASFDVAALRQVRPAVPAELADQGEHS
ncbi:MAG: hypothetical protein JXB36_06410 [Gammaproteobacteria bacterium]|nr:hypothetical protein [Gammaproteobacteria bacterium]